MLVCAAVAAYPFLVYGVLSLGRPWLVILVSSVLLLGGCAPLPRGAWRVAGVVSALLLATLAIALAATASLLFLPPIAVNLGLAWFFGRTLIPGREPLITTFSRMDHAELTPPLRSYTRGLTWIWVAFFVLMALVSAALAAFGAYEAWMWFTAVGNYLCVAFLFAVEYAWRRRKFPLRAHVTPLAQVALVRAAMRARRR